jgi:hypothetical protein
MTVFPTHGYLQDIVQLLQRQVRGNQQASPDRWVRAEQSDLDLVDLLRSLDGVRFGIVRSYSTLRYGAPRCGLLEGDERLRIY